MSDRVVQVTAETAPVEFPKLKPDKLSVELQRGQTLVVLAEGGCVEVRLDIEGHVQVLVPEAIRQDVTTFEEEAASVVTPAQREWYETPESSNLQRFGFTEGQDVLSVQFKNGSTYDYYKVPRAVYEEMKASNSKGQFLAHRIKGTFQFSKVS